MPIVLKKKPKPPKRKPGQKAGLTRASIAAKALGLLQNDPGGLNMLAIAKALGVAPQAIYSHFPGRLPEIQTEMVRTVLADVARPFQVNESWESYIRALFDAVLNAFLKHRNLAPMFGRELSANYYLNPLLVERILFALEMAALPKDERARALDLVLGSLIGFVTIECAGVSTAVSPEKWVQSQSAIIDALPAGEYPQIKALKGALLDVANKRSALKAAPEKARRFADLLITSLKASVPPASPSS